MDGVSNAWIREMCGVKKGLDEKIDEGVLRWCGHVERMERDRIVKRIYLGECAGSRSVCEPLTLTRCLSCGLPQLHEVLKR